ncbi:MAG: hypothetical protein Q8N99_05370 [Nanoarchaeota archaeon]|nr:hypothetical protein [Nanoarchaeota archaeon]
MAYGFTITEVLNMWQDQGVFAYALPFLMIFAIVYGILSKSKLLGENKGVQATIALAFGLLALQFDYVTNFYAIIFPYAGVGLSVLLVALILMGVAADRIPKSEFVWFGIGLVIFVIIILSSITNFAWFGGMGYSWGYAWPAILSGIILLLLMAWITFGNK